MELDPLNAFTLGVGRGDATEARLVFNTTDYLSGWLSDLDGDGVSNAEESRIGSDPFHPDTNGDGMLDGLAVAMGLSATSLDTDGDGLPNSQEILNGTNPLLADSDGDGVGDATDAFPLDAQRSQALPVVPGDVTPPSVILNEPAEAILLP
jgi:hypothetical protein